jgi:hypothetical protein
VRLRVLFLALVLSPLVVAGCGGGQKTYSMAKTRACLVAKKARVIRTPADDFVPNTAGGGTFRVRFPGNQVTLSFGDDRADAERIVRGYQRFAGKNIGLTDVLSAKRNTVILWAVHPRDRDLATIEGCLK